MTATLLRFPRLALWTAALAALGGLALTGAWHRPEMDAARDPSLVCMDGWGVAEMIRHLEARGLGLCALPTWKGGAVIRNAFLTVPGKTFEDVAGLVKATRYIDRWAGVVYCEECPRMQARDLDLLWGGTAACVPGPSFSSATGNCSPASGRP